eukprot:CFRG0943T1
MTGNIRVAIRPKPLDYQRESNECWDIDYEAHKFTCPNRTFEPDTVYRPDECTAGVYNRSVKPLIESSFDGINATIIAYGQTSSGKTHTVHGTTKEPGIMILGLRDVFDRVGSSTKPRLYSVEVSYFQIHNENVTDMLNSDAKELNVATNQQGLTTVQGLDSKTVTSYDEVVQLICQGNARRITGRHSMNEYSSRSHAIFRIKIESKNSDGSDGLSSTVTFVDLAGNERMKKTDTMGKMATEGTKINLSLLTLGRVVQALALQSTRNSTTILRSSSKINLHDEDGKTDRNPNMNKEEEGEYETSKLSHKKRLLFTNEGVKKRSSRGKKAKRKNKGKHDAKGVGTVEDLSPLQVQSPLSPQSDVTFDSQSTTSISSTRSAFSPCTSNVSPKKEGTVHVPYRESRLTRILEPSLKGNSAMLIICTVSLSSINRHETMSTLQFAANANLIEIRPKVNKVALSSIDQIKKLTAENQLLKETIKGVERLTFLSSGEGISETTEKMLSRRLPDRLGSAKQTRSITWAPHILPETLGAINKKRDSPLTKRKFLLDQNVTTHSRPQPKTSLEFSKFAQNEGIAGQSRGVSLGIHELNESSTTMLVPSIASTTMRSTQTEAFKDVNVHNECMSKIRMDEILDGHRRRTVDRENELLCTISRLKDSIADKDEQLSESGYTAISEAFKTMETKQNSLINQIQESTLALADMMDEKDEVSERADIATREVKNLQDTIETLEKEMQNDKEKAHNELTHAHATVLALATDLSAANKKTADSIAAAEVEKSIAKSKISDLTGQLLDLESFHKGEAERYTFQIEKIKQRNKDLKKIGMDLCEFYEACNRRAMLEIDEYEVDMKTARQDEDILRSHIIALQANERELQYTIKKLRDDLLKQKEKRSEYKTFGVITYETKNKLETKYENLCQDYIEKEIELEKVKVQRESAFLSSEKYCDKMTELSGSLKKMETINRSLDSDLKATQKDLFLAKQRLTELEEETFNLVESQQISDETMADTEEKYNELWDRYTQYERDIQLVVAENSRKEVRTRMSDQEKGYRTQLHAAIGRLTKLKDEKEKMKEDHQHLIFEKIDEILKMESIIASREIIINELKTHIHTLNNRIDELGRKGKPWYKKVANNLNSSTRSLF